MLRGAVVLLGFAFGAFAQAPPEGFIFAGVVRNAITGGGIAGANVSFVVPGSYYEATTGDNGEFHISGVKAGSYPIEVHKAGFFFSPPRSAYLIVKAGPNADSSALLLEMLPAAKLRGRIFDDKGKPAAKVQVEASPGHSVAVTASDGSYELTNLAPGSYMLAAWPREDPPDASPDGTRTSLAATYFPSGIEPSHAAPIVLHAGDDLSGYDIRLESTLVYRIGGIVRDGSGNPVTGLPIQLDFGGPNVPKPQVFRTARGFRVEAPGGDRVVRAVRSAKDGSFEFSAVRSGDWLLTAESVPAPSTAFGTAPVRVLKRDVDGVEVRLAPTFDLTAEAVFADERATGVPKAFAVLVGHQVETAAPRPDGSVRFPHVRPGEYCIVASSDVSGYYAAAVLLGPNDVTGQSVELSAASPPVRIVLKPNAGGVRGKVETAGGSSTVTLTPQDFASTGAADLIWIAKTTPSGDFAIENLAPGDYCALAFPGDTPTAAQIRARIAAASPVRIEAGSVTAIESLVIAP